MVQKYVAYMPFENFAEIGSNEIGRQQDGEPVVEPLGIGTIRECFHWDGS